jgi:hypothetical protein
MGAMGLLDDAIREHLELKRLRGADPGDVAREKQTALGPVRHGGETEADGSQVEYAEPDHTDESFSPVSSTTDDSSAVGQETIEINMEAELAASDAGQSSAPSKVEHAAPVAQRAHAQASSEESLEWEMPTDRRHKPASRDGSQGHAGPGLESEQGAEEPVEDVLEETPDFLRDTPEQDRLWFEQRPPRDFDFNE